MLAAENLEVILGMPEETQDPSQRVIEKPKNAPKGKIKARFVKLSIIGLIAALFGSGLYFCSLAVGISTKGYELNRLKAEVNGLVILNERLQLELAQMDSLNRVEAIAVTELGMRKPHVNDYLLLAESSNWGIINDESLSNSDKIQAKKTLDEDQRPLIQQKATALLAHVFDR